MTKKLFLCIGGLLDKKTVTSEEINRHEYTQFNCAYKVSRTRQAKVRSKNRGETLPHSAVYIHDSLFKVLTPLEKIENQAIQAVDNFVEEQLCKLTNMLT